MKKYLSQFELEETPQINSDDVSQNHHLKQEVAHALRSSRIRDIAVAELSDTEKMPQPALPKPNQTHVSVILPAHPNDIKGSQGSTRKATALILESPETDLISVDRENGAAILLFEYRGTVHFVVEETKPLRNYESFTFVANGDFGIPTLHHHNQNELVRLCLDALNHKDTVLYNHGTHTTNIAPEFQDVRQIPPFDYLVIQLSIPKGIVSMDAHAALQNPQSRAQHFDINVFNAHGVFELEKVLYDAEDGKRKVIVSLYYEKT